MPSACRRPMLGPLRLPAGPRAAMAPGGAAATSAADDDRGTAVTRDDRARGDVTGRDGTGGATRGDPGTTMGGPAVRAPRERRRRWASAAAVVAALLAAQALVQAAGQLPASALPGAVVVPSPMSPDNSDATKTISAFCPEGRRVTGGGGRIIRGGGQVVMTRMQPVHTNNHDRFDVTAAEDQGGLGSNWALQAYVICSSPIGQQIVEVTLDAEPDDPPTAFFATASCPSPMRAVGGGGRITGGQGQVQLGHSVDAFSGTAHVAAGVLDADGTDDPWSVTAYAVCAPLSASQVTPVRQTSINNSSNPKAQPVDCPAGMRVSGVGGRASIGTPNVAFESLIPEADAQGVPGDTATVTARETNPTNESWTVQAAAYCVT